VFGDATAAATEATAWLKTLRRIMALSFLFRKKQRSKTA
jgi:hypothetical protein